LRIPFRSWEEARSNAFFAADSSMVEPLERFMDELRASGDSCGARVNVVAQRVPVGWGEPVYGRLDADIASADDVDQRRSKGSRSAPGSSRISQKGSEHGDEMTPQGFASNNNGGVLGGISTGQDVTGVARAETDVQHPHSAPHDRRARGADHDRDHRPPRSVRRFARHADRGGDAGLRADGPRAAPSRPVRRRDAADAAGIEKRSGINYDIGPAFCRKRQ
jgi:hypothetical protein